MICYYGGLKWSVISNYGGLERSVICYYVKPLKRPLKKKTKKCFSRLINAGQ